MSNQSSDNFQERLDKIIEKKNHFLFEVCKYIAEVIFNNESKLYDLVNKKDNSKQETKLLNQLKENKILTLISKMTEKHFNNIFKELVMKKDSGEVEKVNFLAEFFNHSKTCMLSILARLSIQIHLSLYRKELNISNQSDYLSDIQQLLNAELNKQFPTLMETIIGMCNGKCDDEVLKNPDAVSNSDKIFDFSIKFE